MRQILGTLLLALLIASGGCTRAKSAEGDGTPPSAVVAVKTVPVIVGVANVEVHTTGKLDALRKEEILAPIGGRLTALKVLDGEAVTMGEVLAEIEPRESEAAVAGAKALQLRAKTNAERADAERMIALAESTRTHVAVTAPFSGVVAERNATAGQMVSEGNSLIALVDLSTLVFMADVPAGELTSIQVGQRGRIHVEVLPNTYIEAEVDAINPQSDTESQSVKVRLRLVSASRLGLKAGMAGSADIIVGQHENALLVPKSAILRNDETNEHSVVIVGTDSLSHTIPVDIGVAADSLDEVISDVLKPGTQIVVVGQYALADSTKVSANSLETR